MKYALIALGALIILGGLWALFFRGEVVELTDTQQRAAVEAALQDPIANIGYENPISTDSLNPFNQ